MNQNDIIERIEAEIDHYIAGDAPLQPVIAEVVADLVLNRRQYNFLDVFIDACLTDVDVAADRRNEIRKNLMSDLLYELAKHFHANVEMPTEEILRNYELFANRPELYV